VGWQNDLSSEHVKTDLTASNIKLHSSLARQEVQLTAVHKLVNSGYGIALRTGAAALERILERIAEITRSPGDLDSARAARKLSVEHDQKQQALDDADKPKK
jgi:hypothetical protein